MRGLLLTVFISVLCSYAHAQSLRVTNTPDNVFGRTASEISVNISIKNTTKKPIEVIFYRKSSEIPSGQESYFCVGKKCYSPETQTAIETKELRPGEVYDGFKSILNSGLGKSVSTITYCFQNAADPSDEICHTITYNVSSLSANDILFYDNSISVSNIYPNPINDIAIFDYSLKDPKVKAKIILHNVLGGIVEEHPLSELESKLKIYTKSFSPGVYFYTLNVDNQNIITKKFVIKR